MWTADYKHLIFRLVICLETDFELDFHAFLLGIWLQAPAGFVKDNIHKR